MQNIQDVFKRINQAKQQAKQLKRMYTDELEGNERYREILDKLEALKAEKKQIETAIKQDSHGEFQKLDAIKMNIQADSELLSDLAMNTLMAGETVKVKDEFEEEYEPVFKVSFKKARNVAADKAVK